MFFILSKILALFFMPITWIVLLAGLGFFWKRYAKSLRKFSFLLLVIFTNPLLMDMVNNAWEVPIVLDDDLEDHKLAIVLGGYASYDTNAERISFRFGSDRFSQGLRLLQTKKVDRLMICGGSGFVTAPELKEGLFVAQYLDEIGVPKRKIILETDSRNTHENAVNAKAMLDDLKMSKKPVVLVTSGFHMPRAMACFKKQGIEVVPFSTEPMAKPIAFSADAFIPNPMVLAFWNVLFHEWVGYASYWVMGYV
jgi:uncharacterized SAM-binding protein YcdF (DUF218 family)